MREFHTESADELYKVLASRQLVSPDKAEATVHALVDISESVEKMYLKLIPEILRKAEADKELLEECLWELRAEFRHIDYHLRDAELTEWEWDSPTS